MSRPFPDDPFLKGNYAPWPMEGEALDLIVEGEVPRSLNGAYYRNGPNPQFAPRGNYHWFDGDGMIHGFFFENGKVDYRNRWVRTERFEDERKAGESLYGGLTDMGATHESVAGKSPNAANTNIIWHGGKLLALWEAGPPTELDPKTLDTIGLWDFGSQLKRDLGALGQVPGIMTAHPKVDPTTGELLFFGYAPIPPYLVYNTADRDGKLTRSTEIDVPWASMMHDFITTDDHVIFPVFPAIFDVAAIASGGEMMSWQPERGTQIGIMPREGGNDDVVWVQSDPCFVFHPMNAHSEGNRVIAEVARHPSLPLFGGDSQGPATLWRWDIDLASGNVKEEPLDDAPTEFPRLDERFTGKAYRHGYSAGSVGRGTGIGDDGFDSILHYDLKTGKRRAHTVTGGAMGEPVFVPESPDAPEGQGYLVATCYLADEDRSDLLVLDAENVDAPALAKVKLPHRVPFGFHGNWRPATS